jgi:hypothetical protein
VPVHRSTAFVAILTAIVFGAGVGGAVVVRDREPDRSLLRAAPAVEQFVERARGLTAMKPVEMHLAGSAEFRRRLRRSGSSDASDIEAATATLVALGLVPADTNLEKETRALLDANVIGFYDTDTKKLYVRGGKASPFTRVTLAHELTHALQDQHFNLKRFDKLKDEAAAATTALIEGDAVRVERDYALQLTNAEKVDYQLEAGRLGGSGSDVPQVLEDLLVFPYVAGPTFIDAVARRGGNAAVDAVFNDPPTTTEQILHPDRYFDRETAVAVDAPKAGGKVVDQGQLGEYGIQIILDNAVDDDTAKAAADGWGGDRYVTWHSGGRDHFAANITMDTEREAIELQSALARWTTKHRTAQVTRVRASLTLTVDGPPRRTK